MNDELGGRIPTERELQDATSPLELFLQTLGDESNWGELFSAGDVNGSARKSYGRLPTERKLRDYAKNQLELISEIMLLGDEAARGPSWGARFSAVDVNASAEQSINNYDWDYVFVALGVTRVQIFHSFLDGIQLYGF